MSKRFVGLAIRKCFMIVRRCRKKTKQIQLCNELFYIITKEPATLTSNNQV